MTLRSMTLRNITLESITLKCSTLSNSSNTLRRAEGDGARVRQVAEVPRALSVVLFCEGLLLGTYSEVCSEAAAQRSFVRRKHAEE